MEAFSEARRNPHAWNIFPHLHFKVESSPEMYQAGSELEGQSLPLADTTTTRLPGVSENRPHDEPGPTRDGHEEAPNPSGSRLQGGETVVEFREEAVICGQDVGPGAGAGAGTVPWEGLRQRAPGTDRSTGTAAGQSHKNDEPKNSPTLFKHLVPKQPFTIRNQVQRTLFNSWINLLLVAAPIGIIINYIPSVSRVAVFIVNFVAIVPLAAMLGFATEEIALRTGETLGGLLNATFGNAVELIVAIIALVHNQVIIVQTSLIGSILSNLLLVMGLCFFLGGLRRQEQHFNTTVAQTAASLLALAVAGVIVPTVFDMASTAPKSDVAKLSRGTSVILLFVYGGYLVFQLKTHSIVFAVESQKVEAKPFRSLRGRPSLREGAVAQGFVSPAGLMGGHGLLSQQSENEKMRQLLTNPPRGNGKAPAGGDEQEGVGAAQGEGEGEGEGGDEEPQLHFTVAVATLAISTAVIAFCAEYMVDSIGAITAGDAGVSAEFVGLILLPIVGNAAEHATAVAVAVKDKMDLAIGVAVGSSMQIALFVIPLLVMIGWGVGADAMVLSFDPFQVAVLFVAVLLVNYLIADGKSHWLEGMLLICLYSIIANWNDRSFLPFACSLLPPIDVRFAAEQSWA
ncbi:Sodium/calcium exchanger membrane region domain-containing protein [Madurella fahalii]|uniref:Sodium/calcium exchanger membrane region domain-containing protein n=1 Tax=Madurella fahalii TaxID=1157608 RepID=A0ABQ0GMK7_9PEZI